MLNRYIGVFAPEVKTPECADAAIDWSRNYRDHIAEHGLGPDQHRCRSIPRTPHRDRFDDRTAGIIPPLKHRVQLPAFLATSSNPPSAEGLHCPSHRPWSPYDRGTK